jgi:hypothetical protein
MGGLLGFSRRRAGALALPLVQSDDWYAMTSYLGIVYKPTDTYSPPYVFNYGKGMWIHEGNVYMSGNVDDSQGPGRMSLAAISGTCAGNITHNDAILQVPFTGSPLYVSGCMVYGDKLYTSQVAKYDETDENGGVVRCDLDLTNVGSIYTPVSNRDGTNRGTCGPMIAIPEIWQDLLGGPCAILGCQASLIQNCCNGYGFGVFDPADIQLAGGTFPVDHLLWYPWTFDPEVYPSLSRSGDGNNEVWFNQRNTQTITALIPPGSRSLLFLSSHGYGASGGVPECRPGSSVHSGPYRLQVTAYDLPI